MSNPARVLHNIYSTWRDRASGGDNSMVSVVLDPDTEQGARELAETARALVRIDEILTEFDAQGRNVNIFRRQYPEWWKGIIAFHGGWGTSITAEHVMSEAHMDEIEALSVYLDGEVWEIAPAQEENLRSILDDARAALEADETLGAELREFISKLLHEVQVALDDDAIGSTFDYGDAIVRLRVAFKAAEGESATGTTKSVWRYLWMAFLPGTTGAAMVEGGSIVVQNALGM